MVEHESAAFSSSVGRFVSLAIRASTRSDLRLAEKAVLQSIASRLGADGIAWTNYPAIARDTGTTKSVVADVVRYLRKLGVVFVDGPTARRPVMGFSVVLRALEGPAGEPRRREHRAKCGKVEEEEGEPSSGSKEAGSCTVQRPTEDRPAVQDEAGAASVERFSGDRPAGQGDEGENAGWTVERCTVDRAAGQGEPSSGLEGVLRASLSDPDQERFIEEKKERETSSASKPSPRRSRARSVGSAGAVQGALFEGVAEVRESGKRGASKRRGVRVPLPDGWAPSGGMVAWAMAEASKAGLSWSAACVERETAKFCEGSKAKGALWVDWGSAWKNWILKGIEFALERGARAPRVDVESSGPGPRRVVGLQPFGGDSSGPSVAPLHSGASGSAGGCYL